MTIYIYIYGKYKGKARFDVISAICATMLREFQVENIEYQYSKAWFKYFVRDLLELASVIVLTYIKLFLSITLDYIVIRGIKINQLVISNINICFWIYAS